MELVLAPPQHVDPAVIAAHPMQPQQGQQLQTQQQTQQSQPPQQQPSIPPGLNVPIPSFTITNPNYAHQVNQLPQDYGLSGLQDLSNKTSNLSLQQTPEGGTDFTNVSNSFSAHHLSQLTSSFPSQSQSNESSQQRQFTEPVSAGEVNKTLDSGFSNSQQFSAYSGVMEHNTVSAPPGLPHPAPQTQQQPQQPQDSDNVWDSSVETKNGNSHWAEEKSEEQWDQVKTGRENVWDDEGKLHNILLTFSTIVD